MFVEAPSIVVFVLMQMSLGLTLNVIVGFSVVDGRWRGREAILDLDFTISHRCKCQFCQKRFSLRVLALRRVCKQMTIVAMRPCCKTGAKVVLRRSTTLTLLIAYIKLALQRIGSRCNILYALLYATINRRNIFFLNLAHRAHRYMLPK